MKLLERIEAVGRRRHLSPRTIRCYQFVGCASHTFWRGRFRVSKVGGAQPTTAIVWMLFAVPGAVRRRVRIKRGQCASCGYSLRGITSEKCPECGAAV